MKIINGLATVRIRTGIRAGEEVPNGYAGQYCTAPEELGKYTLLQLVDPDTWTHRGFLFEKEE